MKYNMIYITAKDKKEARKIGRSLVSQKLVACVNIIDGINSIYWWEEKIQEDNETILIAKTKKDLVNKVIDKVKKLHSYSCPCIVSIPIDEGNPDYLDWISKEVMQ